MCSILWNQADADNSGTIDYGEFIAATLHLNKIEKQDHLFAAFSYFDKDGSGYITHDELQQACLEFGFDDSRIEEMIQEVDQDNVSALLIHYHETKTCLHSATGVYKCFLKRISTTSSPLQLTFKDVSNILRYNVMLLPFYVYYS